MSEHLRQRWHQRAEAAAGRYTFDVTYAADKDALMAGEGASGTRRVTVEAETIIDAQLLAEQMVAARGWEPIDTLAISWPDEHTAVTNRRPILRTLCVHCAEVLGLGTPKDGMGIVECSECAHVRPCWRYVVGWERDEPIPPHGAVHTPHPLWHLTETRDFKINSEHTPAGYEGYQNPPGLFVTPNPELWANLWGFRQWAAEIDVSGLDASELKDFSMQDRDQFFIPAEALGKLKIKRVVSVPEAYKEALSHGYGFAFLAPSGFQRLCVADGFGSEVGLCGRHMKVDALQKWTTLRWARDCPQVCDECKAKLR